MVALLHAFHTSAPPTSALGRSAPTAVVHTSASAVASKTVTAEGSPGNIGAFQPGASPKPEPIVISLGDDAVSCAGNTYSQLVLVSISRQHLWACERQREVSSTAVTTGETDNGDQTPLGSWRVQAKQRDRYLIGAGYRDYVQYWVPFNGDFGFHDASWQTMPFGSQQYTVHGSHGCVHLPTPTMSWLYNWVIVNQTVVTVES
ncbi:MAG TPA: L,D-transpeptidase [Jatrophihabitans sp.]|nr:L,D-transpeptidase [Jatrophihabitans sp.]